MPGMQVWTFKRLLGAPARAMAWLAAPLVPALVSAQPPLQAHTTLVAETRVQWQGAAPVVDRWETPGPLAPQALPWVRTRGRHGGAEASAVQAINGWFEVEAAVDTGWALPGLTSSASATTQYTVHIETGQPDTPLTLDFLLHGSTLAGAVHYGGGVMDLRAGVAISVARDGGPWQTVWAYQDHLLLDSAANPQAFVHQVTHTDLQGVGLPALTVGYFGWRDFQVVGDVARTSFAGTLDFGLLQPGERFSLRYDGLARASATPRYAAHGSAWLADPFALREVPPALRLAGLDLPMVPLPAVPEPGAAGLWLAGLGLLALWHGRRSGRRPPRPATPGQRLRPGRPGLCGLVLALAAAPAARAELLDYPAPFGNFYGDQPGVLDVHHRVTHLGDSVDGLNWWASGYDDLSGVAWSTYNSPGTLGHVELRVLDGRPLRLDSFRLGSWAGAAGRLETVSVTPIGAAAPVWQFSGPIGVDNRANSFAPGLLSATGFTITWSNPWWTAIDDIRFQTAAVPEPGTALLWLAGLGLWAWRRGCTRAA